jgi:hypothetical protein
MKDIELKDFISESLKQIILGVQQTQTFADKHSALINPSLFSIAKMKREKFDGLPFVQMVDFDIAVTIGNIKGKEGNIGIFAVAASLGVGGKIKSEKRIENISRIKFQIPIRLPSQTIPDYSLSEFRE